MERTVARGRVWGMGACHGPQPVSQREIEICLEQIPSNNVWTISHSGEKSEAWWSVLAGVWAVCDLSLRDQEQESLMRQQCHYYRPLPRTALLIWITKQLYITVMHKNYVILVFKREKYMMCKMVKVLVSFLFCWICCIAFCCDLIV